MRIRSSGALAVAGIIGACSVAPDEREFPTSASPPTESDPTSEAGSDTSGDEPTTTDGDGTTAADGSSTAGVGSEESTAGSSSTGDAACAAGHFCFELPGVFHVADVATPTMTHDLALPAGAEYVAVEVELDVTLGEWYPDDPSGLHNVFWLHRGPFDDFTWVGGVLGYVNLRGPSTNIVRTRHDLDVGDLAESRTFNISGVALEPGHTYHVFYRYDTALAEVRVRITEGATTIAEGTDVPTTDRVRNTDQGYFVYFANGTDVEAAGPEVPSLGWTYADLRIEFLP